MNERFNRRERFPWRRLEGSVVLIDEVEGQLVHFSEVGGRVWEELDGVKTPAQLAELLGREFDAPADAIEKDVRRFIRQLEKRELIERT